MTRVSVEYRLRFEDGSAITQVVDVEEPGAHEHDDTASRNLPDWTRLGHHQCPHCPYDRGDRDHCPVAIKLAPLVETLQDLPSYAPVALEVRSHERRVHAETSLQRAISSLFGLLIASSDCPHTRFLLPMARHHLPLASEGETIYRVAGMYLLGRYLQGPDHDGEDGLEELREHYRRLGIMNRALAGRLRQATHQDAPVNAVVLLDLLARIVPSSIDESLDELRRWYRLTPDAT